MYGLESLNTPATFCGLSIAGATYSGSYSFGVYGGEIAVGAGNGLCVVEGRIMTLALENVAVSGTAVVYSNGITAENSSIVFPGAWSPTGLTVPGGFIDLTNATSNTVVFGAAGVGLPTYTTRSAGTKLVLYPQISGSSVDYGMGVAGNTLWFSIPTANSGFFDWYTGTTLLASLNGTGLLTTSAEQSAGTKYTVTGCSTTGAIGGASAGSFASGTSGTCTPVVTMGGASAVTSNNGWSCWMSNETHPGTTNLLQQTATSPTTATFSGTTVSGDVLVFGCVGY